MYLWTVQLFIYLLFNSFDYSTAEGEYVPTVFGKIGNWFKNLKDKIVGFFRRPFFSASQEDNREVFTNSNDEDPTLNDTFSSPNPPEIPVENDAEQKTSEIFTTTEPVNLSSENPIEESTEVEKTNSSFSKRPQSAEVVEPSN